jgi:hypothetical protein
MKINVTEAIANLPPTESYLHQWLEYGEEIRYLEGEKLSISYFDKYGGTIEKMYSKAKQSKLPYLIFMTLDTA